VCYNNYTEKRKEIKKMILCPHCKKQIHPGNYDPQPPMTFGMNDTLEEIEFTFSMDCPHCLNSLRVVELFLWSGKCKVIPNPPLFIDEDEEEE
jgi:C4-type Zn-finger protein